MSRQPLAWMILNQMMNGSQKKEDPVLPTNKDWLHSLERITRRERMEEMMKTVTMKLKS